MDRIWAVENGSYLYPRSISLSESVHFSHLVIHYHYMCYLIVNPEERQVKEKMTVVLHTIGSDINIVW